MDDNYNGKCLYYWKLSLFFALKQKQKEDFEGLSQNEKEILFSLSRDPDINELIKEAREQYHLIMKGE